MIKVSNLSPGLRQILNWLVTGCSVILCTMLLLTRLPGTELLGIRPHWLLIWVVVWSVKRTATQGAIAGLALGLIQDGMSTTYPSHAISLAMVGILTARMQKQRYIQEDFISIALIVFAMAIIAETVNAIQYIFLDLSQISRVWQIYQRIALCSAILSSLWAPVVYYPLSRWWEYIGALK